MILGEFDRWPLRLLRLALLAAAGHLTFAGGSLTAQQTITVQQAITAQQATPSLPSCWDPLDRAGTRQVHALSCASAACHGQDPADDAASGGTRRQEFVLWLEHDPHARAARTLDSPAFRRILALVSSGNAAGPTSPHVYRRCAQCHDPVGLAATETDAADDLAPSPATADARGIGCQMCHGPAEHWLTYHYTRDQRREELAALGMTDLSNLLVRARRCATCHVGDESHDMNHDMIAAGHPPLRFELSAYHDLIPRKHWSDSERIETREFKAQLWAAGQIAVADSTLALLQSRAERAAGREGAESGGQRSPWPEFAEFDCLACHQRLRPVTSPKRERGTSERAIGTSAWQPWNLALAGQLLQIEPRWKLALHVDPADALQKATLLRTTLRDQPLALALSQSRGSTAPAFTADELLQLIQQPAADIQATWAGECHKLLALKAAYLAWHDEFHKLPPPSGPDVESAGGDFWSRAFRKDLDDLAVALRFGSKQFEWPAFDWDGLPTDLGRIQPKYKTLPEIEAKIRELAAQLRQRQEPLGATITPATTQP